MSSSYELDIVTVFHRDETRRMALDMLLAVAEAHPDDDIRLIPIDNRVDNRGFAKGCNLGAVQGSAPIIGFINPDATVRGPFLEQLRTVFTDPNVLITGCRYGKPQGELRQWGVTDWVCGAAMFVRRSFFESVAGFDEQFVMYFEETDLIRRAQLAGGRCQSIDLPIEHASPLWDPPEDVRYKHYWFDESARRFYAKWRHR